MAQPAHWTLRQRILILRWLLPLALAILSVMYQHGPATWVHDYFSHSLHYIVEIFFYGLVGPVFVYMAVRQIGRWLEEKEHAESLAHSRAAFGCHHHGLGGCDTGA